MSVYIDYEEQYKRETGCDALYKYDQTWVYTQGYVDWLVEQLGKMESNKEKK